MSELKRPAGRPTEPISTGHGVVGRYGNPAGGVVTKIPATFVDHVMVDAAHHGEVVQVGDSSGLPWNEVVNLTPAGRAVTAWEDAVPVPVLER